jgi:hypothetical protein
MYAVRIALFAVVAFFVWSESALAQYTLVLKNGRRITVKEYREEGGMIKFYGLGGEIGIARDQVKAILKPGEKEERGMVVPGTEAARTAPAEAKPEEKEATAPKTPAEAKPVEQKGPSPEEKQAEERAKDEKEYQKKIRELTERLKSARDRYSMATRGSAGPEPSVLTDEQAIKARTQDLTSRLRDVQHAPSSGAPQVDVPRPGYSDRERQLSDLRNEIYQLEKQRDGLIEEMRQKNFETGSLFLE